MDFRKYQELALKTEQTTAVLGAEVIVPLLGLASEAGELLGEYKKYLRDGAAHRLFQERVAEELGDLLWYIANVARKFDLDLNFIAESNLEKCRNLWGEEAVSIGVKTMGHSFDCDFPEHERLPRKFEVEITEVLQGNSIKMKAFVNGQQIGNDLTDNSYANDGYRFHDVFHLAYAGVLGWSPVTRQLLSGCKRKSNPKVDEVEDGGRAKAIEEGISALVFNTYAKNHAFFQGVSTIDYHLLRTIKDMTSQLEVARCSLRDWEKAILMGYEVWRQVDKNRGGIVVVNLDARSITYQALSGST
jgi:NTP pyrophosphatase (non-canonical NTP hydrolase)